MIQQNEPWINYKNCMNSIKRHFLSDTKDIYSIKQLLNLKSQSEIEQKWHL